MSLLGGCQQSTDNASNNDSPNVGETKNSVVKKPKPENEGKMTQVQYLEIVITDVDALCNQYSALVLAGFVIFRRKKPPLIRQENSRIVELRSQFGQQFFFEPWIFL